MIICWHCQKYFWINIFKFSIWFIWLNAAYIILISFCAILCCGHDIGQHPELSQICSYMDFTFVGNAIFLHDFYPQLLSCHFWLWQSWSPPLLFSLIISELIYACFSWHTNFLYTVYLSRELYHGQISIGLGYSYSAIWCQAIFKRCFCKYFRLWVST